MRIQIENGHVQRFKDGKVEGTRSSLFKLVCGGGSGGVRWSMAAEETTVRLMGPGLHLEGMLWVGAVGIRWELPRYIREQKED